MKGSEVEKLIILLFNLALWGGLAGLALALLGYKSGPFFSNFIPMSTDSVPSFRIFSAPLILMTNIVIGLKVGAILFMAFLILAVIRVVPDKKGKMKMVQKGKEV